jgi:hypothetical protein
MVGRSDLPASGGGDPARWAAPAAAGLGAVGLVMVGAGLLATAVVAGHAVRAARKWGRA